MAFSSRLWVCPCLLHLFVLAQIAVAFPLQNITLPLPVGSTNHNTPGLLCTPTKWTDIALFYLFNYVAHAATVLTRPGERSDDYMAAVIGSLLLPALGLYRGIEAIFGGAVFVKKNDHLRKAAKSGALCMLVRARDWRPVNGDHVKHAVFKRAILDRHEVVKGEDGKVTVSFPLSKLVDEESTHVMTYSPPWLNSKFGWPVYVHRQIIHGIYNLPEGYRFAIVPSDTHFTATSKPDTIVEVSATYNLVKALVALIQSGYALLTLYRSRGDQIEQFGYAAFGLTVAPYAVMSAMNLIGNLCRPDYASLYMVENGVMDEARRRGGTFEGFVGRVEEDNVIVCGCGLAHGDDAEDLRFSSNEDGSVTADFGVSSPPEVYHVAFTPGERHPDKIPSVYSSLTQHSHPLKQLPTKLDYASTDNDALLLIPCCSPIRRSCHSTPSAPADIPCQHRLEKLSLRKYCPPFKRYYWHLTFAPTLASSRSFYWRFAKYFITVLIALTPLAINGAMSHFEGGAIPARESSNWRVYVIQWLVVGVFSGISWVLDQEGKEASLSPKFNIGPILRIVLYLASSSPAVGGFIVVGQMLHRYGVCTWVGD